MRGSPRGFNLHFLNDNADHLVIYLLAFLLLSVCSGLLANHLLRSFLGIIWNLALNLEGRHRAKKEAAAPGWQVAALVCKGILHRRLVLGGIRRKGSLHLLARPEKFIKRCGYVVWSRIWRLSFSLCLSNCLIPFGWHWHICCGDIYIYLLFRWFTCLILCNTTSSCSLQTYDISWDQEALVLQLF